MSLLMAINTKLRDNKIAKFSVCSEYERYYYISNNFPK